MPTLRTEGISMKVLTLVGKTPSRSPFGMKED
jgi:hypothetical protein